MSRPPSRGRGGAPPGRRHQRRGAEPGAGHDHAVQAWRCRSPGRRSRARRTASASGTMTVPGRSWSRRFMPSLPAARRTGRAARVVAPLALLHRAQGGVSGRALALERLEVERDPQQARGERRAGDAGTVATKARKRRRAGRRPGAASAPAAGRDAPVQEPLELCPCSRVIRWPRVEVRDRVVLESDDAEFIELTRGLEIGSARSRCRDPRPARARSRRSARRAPARSGRPPPRAP